MSITINVTPTTGGSFTAAGVESGNITLTVGGGIGPPGAGNVALAAGAGIAITSTANVATITSTVQGVSASNLADLADVDATAPTSGQVLEWNGTAWAPGLDSTLTLSSTGGSDLGASTAGASSEAARADHVHNLPALADLVGVSLGTPSSGQVLAYNGTAWAPTADNALTLSSDAGADLGTAAAGSAGVAARADHVHRLPTFAEITNGTATVTGNLTLDPSTGGVIISGGTSAGSLTLNCEQNTHGVTIASPAHSQNATYTLTLPSSAGSANQVLTTDGTGSLSWSNGSSGSGGISWTSPAPGNSTDNGSAGDVAYGGQYFYLHNGTQWNRVLLSSFGSTGGNVTTYRLLTESSDTLLTEGGDYLSHDGNGTWTQLGSDIDGEAAGDQSGYSVALSSDGSRVAIGATHNDGNGDRSGHVRIYDWSGSAWVQAGADIDGEAALDTSGYSVALSSDGSRVAIGATNNDDNGGISGHVRIYGWSGSAWVQVGADIDGEAAGDFSGNSVALSSDGSRVAIGATHNDGNGASSGHVRIYDWSGSAWVQVGADIDGEAAGDFSGNSVALSSDGSRVAIGATHNDGNGADSGHVRIYDWSGSAWVQVGADIDGEAAGDFSGWAVAMAGDGSRVAIGAYRNDGNGTSSGHVRIYDWSGSAWVQVGADIDGEALDDRSGWSVALSSDGSRVAIGADRNDGNGTASGHVRIYDWSGSAWVQVGADIDGEAAGDNSGWAVAMAGDGSRVAIGAYRNDGTGTDAGHVRVFDSP